MPAVVFYEKPGCLSNARQKTLLASRGAQLTVKNLLAEPWTEKSLYAYLRARPVDEWFNPSAPRIKSGEIDPAAQDKASAMALLLDDPLLIRRPLLDTEFGKTAGFDDPAVLVPLGVYRDVAESYRACSKPGGAPDCPQPE
jgi:nitrogenase-associated protein